jgi:hypothetical protein
MSAHVTLCVGHREAAGLTAWSAGQQGGVTAADRDAMMASLLPFLAEDLDPDDIELDEDDEEGLDDAEVFVEVKQTVSSSH